MKIVCIDSFKEEYLEYAPYLKSLTEKYQYGSLKVPVGFWGGMETFSKGNSDILAFFYYSENSSLRWTKYFRFLGKFLLNCLINSIRLIKGEQLFYTYDIPLNKLYMFDTAVKKKLNFGKDYLRIGDDLDKIAHKYGTKSDEVKNCVKKNDDRLRKMDFDLIMSDHGMVDVKETIEVPFSNKCLIDSTLARYWGNVDEIKKKLPLKKGKIINWNKKYGDLIFLANPGVLIFPNSRQKKVSDKAMHGYDKQCNGFYIVKKENKRKNLDMKELHKIAFNSS